MKALAVLLAGVSIAFGAFSIASGYNYRRTSSEGYLSPIREQIAARVDRELDEIHQTVKLVSLPYYLACLGFFVAVLKKTSRRKGPIFAIVTCVLMSVWTLMLDSGLSIDEVSLAWLAAAIVLGILQLVTLGSAPKPA